MWPMSSAAALKLPGSHTAVSRVDILHAGEPIYSLDAASGSVQAEVGRPVFRTLLGCTVVDPTGELSGGDINDKLSPYNCEVAVYRGVLLDPLDPTSGEYAPLGVFGLTSRAPTGDGGVQITGQDRAMGYQGPMTGPVVIEPNTPIEDAIARLLGSRNRGVTFAQTWRTGFTVGPLLFEADIDVWKAVQELAKSVGGWLYHDRMGGLVFASLLPSVRTPVARYADGEGTGLIDLSRQEDSDTIRNVVVVESAKTATGGVIRAVIEDDDPASPTYSRGRYGRRPITITNEHIGSLAQAQQMASTELVRQLGRSETVALTVVPDPRRDPLDVIAVHRPRAGLINRGMVVQSVEIPLAAESTMSIGLQRSIIAQDGTALEVPIEVT